VSPDDHRFMARAIRLARRGLYTTNPNPRVGCVLVRDGEIVGEGYHVRAGEPHAERNAIAAAGVQARGATAYVTLEPCCHHGKTPPCSDGLIEAGVSRVVAAMQDPNPLVAGKGMQQLSAAGIETGTGLLEPEAMAINPGFIKRQHTGLPYVRCKLAMSLDGRTAMASGESKWITGPAARQDVQRLRARSSAIVTGIETVLADDPSMNVRLDDTEVVQPLRVVLDSSLRTPPDARMLGLEGKVMIVCCAAADKGRQQALEQAGAEVLRQEGSGERVGLESLLRYLAGQEINEVLLETGAVLAGSWMAAGLIDELVVYIAPHFMGAGARGLLEIPGLERMQDRVDLEIMDLRQVGQDLRITARPSGQGTGPRK
jgi:diaminohydroxyphosphoribosylaminopyrimidine deaminase / 5-amino-6-(5-phosphoribosylamino)uracil reductase